MRTKIEWCDFTWNPVWGCQSNCPYCYARKFARRFGAKVAKAQGVDAEQLTAFKPTFLDKNFGRAFPKKPSRIFVNSMSDLCYWRTDWLEKVIAKAAENKHHQFLFLTKQPGVYNIIHTLPKNIMLGVSVSTKDERWRIEDMKQLRMKFRNRMFVSLEPLLRSEAEWMQGNFLDWTIVGLETGRGKKNYNPPCEAIRDLYSLSRLDDCPLFMKDSVARVWDEPLTREFPGT